MIMKIKLLLILLIATATVNAQTISGNLINNFSNEPIRYAVLQLMVEGQVISQTISEEDGYFNLKKKKTEKTKPCILVLSSVETGTVAIDTLFFPNENNQVLKNIMVTPKITQLNAVTITGDIGVTTVEPQKIKYSTADLISQNGGTAGDILKNMPSVTMGGSPNHNRDIRYRGLGNGYTAVLINGRNAGINGNNRETVLNMIPASQIESIEISSQPGADVQSDGINGVVNIILKKNVEIGTHGTVMFLADTQGGYNGNLTLQHKNGPLQFTGSFEQLNNQADKTETGFQHKFEADGALKEVVSIDKNEMKRFDNTMARVHIKYQASNQWFLETEYLYGRQKETKIKEELNLTSAPDGTFLKGQNRIENEIKVLEYHNSFLKVKKVFNNQNELEISINASFNDEEKNKLRNDYKATETGMRVETENPKRQRETEAVSFVNLYPSAHYKLKLSGNNKMKIGYQGFLVDRESEQIREDYNFDDGTWKAKTDNFNTFSLQENTHAFYISGDWLFNQFKLTTGYRHEITNITSQSIIDSLDVGENTYNLPLPNLQLTYNVTNKAYLTASFGRRVRRPGYKDLNPFREIKDLTEIKEGNPELRPETAWTYELGYFQQLSNLNYGVNLFYRDINDLIQKSITTIDTDIILERPVNLNGAYTAGFELITGISPLKWWNVNLNYSQFWSEITDDDNFEGDAIKDQTAWTAKAINDFKLPWNTSLQLVGNFVGPKASSQQTEDTIWYFDFGIEKKFLENGYFILRVSDIFDSLQKVKTKNTGTIKEIKTEDTQGRILTAGIKLNF